MFNIDSTKIIVILGTLLAISEALPTILPGLQSKSVFQLITNGMKTVYKLLSGKDYTKAE